MYLDFVEQELSCLEKRTADTQGLLDGYQKRLDFSNDSRNRAIAKCAIKQLKSSVNIYIQDYTSLKATWHAMAPSPRPLEDQLTCTKTDINILKDGQVVILSQLDHTRPELLGQHDISQQRLAAEAVQQLEQSQLKLVQSLLNILDNKQLTQAEISEPWHLVNQNLPRLSPEQAQIIEIAYNPDLDKHNLKISVPLIPRILGYEVVVELDKDLNLKTLWTRVKD
mgnify:CR=1 FL=1